MEGYLDLIKMILPEILVAHFDLVATKKEGEKLHLYFEEKNKVPEEFNSRQLISKGFHKSITVQDFPLKGMFVFFHIKRRRWTDKKSSEILQRDWTLVANGTRMTKEFAAFLKSINRY
ncbi:ISAon1 family transposase N-terminal region protein [Polaribacter sp.]|uniref:ISAon1 family transposase N-terminal region protein n=1 Tax=Polaribacter sp. TaxID=1920175 RepID=UPI003F6AA804